MADQTATFERPWGDLDVETAKRAQRFAGVVHALDRNHRITSQAPEQTAATLAAILRPAGRLARVRWAAYLAQTVITGRRPRWEPTRG